MRQAMLLAFVALLALAACQRDEASSRSATTPAAATEAGVGASATPPPAMPVAGSPAARRIKADVDVLADDRFAGRQTGSRGFDLAADHVAARYRELGLEPAGDDGTWFQRVPLLKSVRARDGARLVVHRNGRDIALRFGDQYLPAAGFDAAQADVTAPAVFVNQGIVAPALHVDDLAGRDLTGKVAVLFRGAPDGFSDDQRALHGGDEDKLRRLAGRGAIGVVFVNSGLDEARVPWATTAAAWDKPQMRLRGEDGAPLHGLPGLRVVATVSAAAADLLFADQPRSAAELAIQASRGQGKGFALPGTLTLSAHSTITSLDARNVVARLPGSDPALAGAPVVTSAHLDHLGIGKAVAGNKAGQDVIHHGAIDNALGVAIMLESARTLVGKDVAPTDTPPGSKDLKGTAAKDMPSRTVPSRTVSSKRPQLFLASTGGEQGALGARWFATHPPGGHVPVADIDFDTPVLTAPTTDVVAIGNAHSSLQAALAAAATHVGVAVSPDPYPEDDAFVRGDHAAFVRSGIPALYLTGGTIAADKTRKPEIALRYYLRNCYQRPCDDADQPIQYDDAARLARLGARVAWLVGNDAKAPRWNAGDAFGVRLAK